MSEDKEIFDMGDKCKIEFSSNGNIKIMGNCDGKVINKLDLSIFNKVNTMIDEDEV